MSEIKGVKNYLPFDLLFKNSTDKVFVTNGKDILFVNDKLLDFLEIKKQLVFPCSTESFLSGENLSSFNKLLVDFNQKDKSEKQNSLCINNHQHHAKYSIIQQKEQNFFVFTLHPLAEELNVANYLNQHFSEVFPFIVLQIDLNGKIQRFNDQLQKQLFFTEKDVAAGLHLEKMLSAGSKPIVESLLKNFGKFKNNRRLELKFKKKFGENFPGHLYYKPIIKDQELAGLNCLLLNISNDKEIEYKYKQNQQRLRKVLDLVPHMIFLKDRNGNILLANKACADFYNTTTKQLVYSKITDFHQSSAECDEIQAEDRAVISERVKRSAKTVVRTDPDNVPHFFESTKMAYTEPLTKQVHSLGILVDVTEKTRVEREIEETKEKYRLLVERGTDGILIIQTETIVFANNQAASIFGQPLEDVVNQPLGRFIKKSRLKKALEKYAKDTQNKTLDNNYEVKISKPEGEPTYVEAKVSTINYEGQKSRLVFIRDITKRKVAEKKSERDKNMLKQAQKIAQLGSWEWDVQNKTFMCSDEIYRILSVESNKQVRKSPKWLIRFIPSFDKNKILGSFINSLRTGESLDIEFPITTNNEERKIIHSQSQVYFDRNGKLERAIGTLLDVSGRIRIEQALKVAKSKAEESDKLKSAFLANMSHEIRTPMNAILGFANLLKKQGLPNETHLEYIDHIQQSGEGLLKLINDIVDISKIESNQLQIENSPILINNMLDKLYNRYEELLVLKSRHAIRLRVEKALPDPKFTVVSDAFRLQQVISNLLNNSIKFTVKGTITFGYSIAKSQIKFFVQDEGVGIPDDKKSQIFKRFGKLNDPARMNKSGTGLGLSISKSLVDLMQGKIWLESGESGNTRFCFTIPLQYAESIKLTNENCSDSHHAEAIQLHQKTILIAEDELLNYKLLETLLLKTGAEVLWAKNGLEAVKIASSRKVDLIFMDIKMPEMNGYEATKAIKEIDSTIPIIAQTAFAFANERKYILQSGCDMYLTKPINHKEIYKVVNRFLVKE